MAVLVTVLFALETDKLETETFAEFLTASSAILSLLSKKAVLSSLDSPLSIPSEGSIRETEERIEDMGETFEVSERVSIDRREAHPDLLVEVECVEGDMWAVVVAMGESGCRVDGADLPHMLIP